jgi:hypothetical protein
MSAAVVLYRPVGAYDLPASNERLIGRIEVVAEFQRSAEAVPEVASGSLA